MLVELIVIYHGLVLAKGIILAKGPNVRYHVHIVSIQDINELLSQSNITLCHITLLERKNNA
jgi:hypothetical protein